MSHTLAKWKQIRSGGARRSYGPVTVIEGPTKVMREYRAYWWRRVYRYIAVSLGYDPYPDTEEFLDYERKGADFDVTLAPGESISLEELLWLQGNDPD